MVDLPLSNDRRMTVDEFDSGKMLAHAARQSKQRGYEKFPIIDVDSHHYELESFNEILEYMPDPVMKQLAQMANAGNSKGVGVMPGGVGYQDMGGRAMRYPLRRIEKPEPGVHRDVSLTRRWIESRRASSASEARIAVEPISSDSRSGIGRESGADEVIVESEELTETELLHDRETRTVHPADPAVPIPSEEMPGMEAGCAPARGADLDRSATRPRPRGRRGPRGERSSAPSRPTGHSVEIMIHVRRELGVRIGIVERLGQVELVEPVEVPREQKLSPVHV
jgi:hypothetical protein